jgi:hypothetical protein
MRICPPWSVEEATAMATLSDRLSEYMSNWEGERNELTRYAIANRIIALLEADPTTEADYDQAQQLQNMLDFSNQYWDSHA